MVELRKAERCFAQFTVFLLRMCQPLHQAILVHELNAPTALARVEQRFFLRSFAATDPASIDVIAILLFAFIPDIKGWIVHDIWL